MVGLNLSNQPLIPNTQLFNGQLSFADIDAEKFLHVRRAHADRRVNAMDRLTDDVINELIQLCLPHYHIKAGETVQP